MARTNISLSNLSISSESISPASRCLWKVSWRRLGVISVPVLVERCSWNIGSYFDPFSSMSMENHILCARSSTQVNNKYFPLRLPLGSTRLCFCQVIRAEVKRTGKQDLSVLFSVESCNWHYLASFSLHLDMRTVASHLKFMTISTKTRRDYSL